MRNIRGELCSIKWHRVAAFRCVSCHSSVLGDRSRFPAQVTVLTRIMADKPRSNHSFFRWHKLKTYATRLKASDFGIQSRRSGALWDAHQLLSTVPRASLLEPGRGVRLTCAVELELGAVDRLWSVCVPLAMIKALTKIARRSERLVRRLHGESNGGFEECT
jgi:hypothetical protein